MTALWKGIEMIQANDPIYIKAAENIYNEKLNTEEIKKRKALYLDVLVHFMEIYAQTEVGECDLDITKIALFINRPAFENDETYYIKTEEDVYSLYTTLTLEGLPVWRFLKLSDYQKKIFEKGYINSLSERRKAAGKICPCYDCAFYSTINTALGTIYKCNRPRGWERRERPLDTSKKKRCRYQTNNDKSMDTSQLGYMELEAYNEMIEKYNENYFQDTFIIPKELSNKDIVSLSDANGHDKHLRLFEDLGCSCQGNRTVTERIVELRKAMLIEGAIRFLKIFAETEYGTDYEPDIAQVALWVENQEDLSFIEGYDDIYTYLENLSINEKLPLLIRKQEL